MTAALVSVEELRQFAAAADDVPHAELLTRCLRSFEALGYVQLELDDAAAAAVSSAYVQARAFHALPLATKQLVSVAAAQAQGLYGGGFSAHEPAYVPSQAQTVASYSIRTPLSRADCAAQGVPAREARWHANPYPAELQPAFERDIEALFAALLPVSSHVARLLPGVLRAALAEGGASATAAAAAVPRDLCSSRISARANVVLRLLHYPAAGAPDAVGISAHTDFELFTLLHQSSQGLEVGAESDAWRVVPHAAPAPAPLTLILGEMAERLSAGRLRATRHRVPRAPLERLSIALFQPFDDAVTVAPLPAFLPAARRERLAALRRYPPVTQARWYEEREGAATAERRRQERAAAGGGGGGKRARREGDDPGERSLGAVEDGDREHRQ